MKRLNGLAIAAAAVLVACERTPSQPAQLISAASFNNFDAISGSAQCAAPPSTAAGFATYEPFVLPAGYSQRILATQGADFAPVAGSGGDLPDMNTLNETGPSAGRFLYRTHEVGSNGAVTVTDLVTGVTSLAVQQSHYERLDGIVWSPWQTVLFAEEAVNASRRDPAFPNALRGLVYEYDPATGVAVARPAVGARSHEGLRFDPQGNLYGISESTQGINGSGAIYKFVPNRRGDLTSGQLYALKVLAASRTGAAVWVPLDGALSEIDSDQSALNAGATGWGRPEDVEIGMSTGSTPGGLIMYVAVTSENLVLKIELSGDEAFVTNYVQNVAGFSDPDNLALDAQGNLFITEDNGPGDIWVARAGEGGAIERFASLSDCAAEPTGIYFDRGAHVLYVNVQHAGGPLSNDLLVAVAPSN
jgi:uncharacterized protein